jgi:type IV secretory pathway VirB4 component
MLSSIEISRYKNFDNSQFWSVFLKKQATSITMAGEGIKKSFREFLNLSEEEMSVLLKLPLKSRCFIVKQYGFMISAELNLNEFPQFTKILSQSDQDRQSYEEIVSNHKEDEIALRKLYKKFGE